MGARRLSGVAQLACLLPDESGVRDAGLARLRRDGAVVVDRDRLGAVADRG